MSKKEAPLEELIDPIMLLPIPSNATLWTFIRPNGTQIIFDVETLVQYFQSTSQYVDPESQLAFSDEELGEIEEQYFLATNIKVDLVKNKNNKENRREYENNLNALYGVERMIGERVALMLDIVESDRPRNDQLDRELHQLMDESSRYFQQMCTDPANSEFANQSLQHYIQFMKGPKNRPTKERQGLLQKCLDFLEGLFFLTTLAFEE